jgi:myosin-1
MERVFKKGLEDDLILLEDISEHEIVETLHRRFQDATIYTYIGEVLLSVNPFRPIQIYSKDAMHKYASRNSYELRPHIFATAEAAYKSSRRGFNQCILITGESGAGKTEASKKVMEYISEIADGGGDVSSRIKAVIQGSNALLEAFGNAKTVRNNNSSRFGKYMEIMFDPAGAPASGRVSNFLLEKPRVVGQTEEERSFHIFYQVLSRYCETGVLPPQGYHYLNQTTCYAVNGIDDAADWEDVREAFGTVGCVSHVNSSLHSCMDAQQ